MPGRPEARPLAVTWAGIGAASILAAATELLPPSRVGLASRLRLGVVALCFLPMLFAALPSMGEIDQYRRDRAANCGRTTALAAGVPMFGGDPAHTGVQPGPGVVGKPTLLWTYQAPNVTPSSVALTAVDGAIYVGFRFYDGERIGGGVMALDASTGAERWRYATKLFGVDAAPAVADGRVYFSDDLWTVAVDEQTGERRWRTEESGVNGLSVTVSGGAYFYARDELVAVDPETGGRCWLRSLSGFRQFESPAVVDGHVFAFLGNEELSALEALTGEERWRFAAPGLFGTPAVRDGIVYVGSRFGTMFAVDAATGGELWRTTVPGGWGGWAVDDTLIYVAMARGEAASALVALDRASGLVCWQSEIQHPWTTPVIVGDEIYLVSGDAFRAFESQTGVERWSFPIEGGRVSTPAVVDGVVYLSTDAGIVYAIGGSGNASW